MCVDAKAASGQLGEMRSSCEVEDVHVVKDVVSVNSPKDEGYQSARSEA